MSDPPDSTFFLGIGAEKAGTSWLRRRLMEHPEVWTPPHKEIHYFDQVHLEGVGTRFRQIKYQALQKRVAATTWEDLARPGRLFRMRWFAAQGLVCEVDDAWYRGLFAEAMTRYRVVGEITPSYAAIGEKGFRHMATLLPDARIIFLMRHPVDRLWSAVRYSARRGEGTGVLDSPEAMVRYASRPTNMAKSEYHVTMAQLAEVYSPQQVLYAFYEDIFASEEAQLGFLRRVCEFLGVAHDAGAFVDLAEIVNASPPHHMPAQFGHAMTAKLASVFDEVERLMGRVPTSWRSSPG